MSPMNQEWCQIVYFELNVRVSETFHGCLPCITIDGFTNPEHVGARFSLGSLYNANRNAQSKRVLRHISRGIEMHFQDGEVIVLCLSPHDVFIHSPCMNKMNDYPTSTVCRIVPGSAVKVFSNSCFSACLTQALGNSFEAVYNLTKLCMFHISFAKGFGNGYNRKMVSSTPCWLEVTLTLPLILLDHFLIRLGSPTSDLQHSSPIEQPSSSDVLDA